MKKRVIKAFWFLLLFFLSLNAMRRKPKQVTISSHQATQTLKTIVQAPDSDEVIAIKNIEELLAAGACLDCEEKLAQGTQGFTPICAVVNRGWINGLRLFLAKLREVYGDEKQKYLNLFCRQQGFGPIYWAVISSKSLECVRELFNFLVDVFPDKSLVKSVLQNEYSDRRSCRCLKLIEWAREEKAEDNIIGLLEFWAMDCGISQEV